VERDGAIARRLDAQKSFGELGLVDDAPRAATIRADGPTRLLRLSRNDFQETAARCSEVGVGLLRTLAGWLRR
jgi:CRP-like cAMP-binding protein